ncbi:speckle-type POZ protein B [Caerostris extrusa]|uniref:Speckle-type POZ protein B n=1 Tax=Caerostris extrusa TaxID=172846 RepID=A0AAV4T0E8_CAEEX|nr:speckle-type POZ protein B [Caerostris extrusa]
MGFTVQWALTNPRYVWHAVRESIHSPAFVVDALEGTKWSLGLCGKRLSDENHFEYCLFREGDCDVGVEEIEVNYELSLLRADGSVLEKGETMNRSFRKGGTCGTGVHVTPGNRTTLKRLGFTKDTLTTRCRMWRPDGKATENVHCFVRTRVEEEKRSFVWNIEKFSTLRASQKTTYTMKSFMTNEPLMKVNHSLVYKGIYPGLIQFKFTAANYVKMKFLEIRLFTLDTKGNRTEFLKRQNLFCDGEIFYVILSWFVTENQFLEAKKMYFPDDVFSLLGECTFSTGTVHQQIEAVHYGDFPLQTKLPGSKCPGAEARAETSTSVSEKNRKSSFNHGPMSDAKLKNETCSFPTHKNVVGSAVFEGRLSNDANESVCNDDDTARRMLEYMRTADVDKLNWKSACRFYTYDKKYQVLKERCRSYLKTNLLPNNACEALVLADRHCDEDLKGSVQQFILKHSKEVIDSAQWDSLMKTDIHLAAETMRLKCKE